MAGKKPVRELIGRALSWWAQAVGRRALAVALLSLAAAGYSLFYAAGHLGINTDTASMISEKLPWRQTYLEYKSAFPEYFGEIAVVIDARSPDIAERARTLLEKGLRQEGGGLYKSVYSPGGGEFFERNGLLYLKTEKLNDLADNLASVQPFIGKLIHDQSLVGLFSMLDDAMEAVLDGEEVELAPVFDHLAEAFEAHRSGSFYEVSWQEIMLGRTATFDERRRFIIVRPQVDFTELFPGGAAIEHIRGLAERLQLDPAHGVQVRLTGSVALAYEELKSVMRGAGMAGAASVVLVAVLLLAALGSVRMMAASLLSLLAGLAGTAAFAAAAVGELNLISMAFAVLYIGLGIDYAIHLCLRYRELIEQGNSHDESIKKAARGVGASLALCALTTSAGFYAFIPTAYSGVSELGLISGTGMFISLLANLTLLPALLSLMPLAPRTPPGAGKEPGLKSRLLSRAADAPVRHRRAVLAVVLAAGAASVALLPYVRFNSDPMELRDPRSESVRVYNDLMRESETPPMNIAVVKDSLPEAERSAKEAEKLPTVDKAVTIADFVPEDQDARLAIIEDISLLLGPELELEPREEPAGTHERLSAFAELKAGLALFAIEAEPVEAEAAKGLLKEVEGLMELLTAHAPSDIERILNRLQDSLISSLPERLRVLRAGLDAGPVEMGDLPVELKRRWVSPDGKHLVQVYPRENITDNMALERFVEEAGSAEPRATGMPVFILKAGEAVTGAFERAFLLALIFICAILYALVRSVTDTVLVLIPLLLAGLLTGAATVILSIPFNFANIIALPLLLGIGVDNGIHMVHRARTTGARGILATSTTRAVFYSTFTTIASFGTLAFSSHLGVASMGKLLAAGVLLTLVCTVAALPALLAKGADGGEGK